MESQTSVSGGVTSVTFASQPTPPVETPSAGTAPGPERPEWLPEEFDTPEAFAEAYKAMKGSSPEPPKAKETQPQPNPQQNQDEVDYAVKVVEDAGLDYDAVSAHFAENGSLAPEHYAALEAKGFPRQLVDNYLNGQLALQESAPIQAERFRNTVLSAAGGEDAWKAAADWAAAGNLTDAELAAYNAAVESNDVERAKLAVQGLIARHAAAMGAEPDLADGQGGAAPVPGFRSRAELVAAINDPRYEKDPAYRADVVQRLARSNV